jgi:adenine deaminase
MVTINPAIQLGIDKRVGSIEAGKDADLVIWNHHPLSIYAVAQKSIIDGTVYFDRKKDIEHRAEIEKEKKALMDKEKAAAPARQGPPGKAPGQEGAPQRERRRPPQKGQAFGPVQPSGEVR